MNGLATSESRRARSELLHELAIARSVSDVFAAASRRLHVLVPHDAAAWVMTDPATGFPTAPSLLDGFSAPLSMCSEHWHREFVEPDHNHFRRLFRADSPAAGLRASVVEPGRSSRFRWFIQPLGFGDDLRAVFRVGETPWAITTLWRRAGERPFTPTEARLVAGLSTPVGDAVRRIVRQEFAATAAGTAEVPGLLLFDAADRLTSASDGAAAWLDELPRQELIRTGFGLELPLWLLLTAARARTSLLAGGDGIARTRARTRTGRWVVAHASASRDADGAPTGAAVTIDRATPSMLIPVAAGAYGLTEREQEITGQIARGHPTDNIAGRLFLSPHTVRDHVKSILNKVGVSSRGELVAALYTDHVEPAHVAEVGGQRFVPS